MRLQRNVSPLPFPLIFKILLLSSPILPASYGPMGQHLVPDDIQISWGGWWFISLNGNCWLLSQQSGCSLVSHPFQDLKVPGFSSSALGRCSTFAPELLWLAAGDLSDWSQVSTLGWENPKPHSLGAPVSFSPAMEQVVLPSLGVDAGMVVWDGLTAPAAVAVGLASCVDALRCARAKLINLTFFQSGVSLIKSVALSLELHLLVALSCWTWLWGWWWGDTGGGGAGGPTRPSPQFI